MRFYKLCHKILSNKLQNIRIRGTALDTFWLYLTNRDQNVQINTDKMII